MNDDITTKHQQDSYKYSVEQFDKSILFIASGALGGSFAFIKDVIPDLSKAFGKWLLISSWYIFGIVIFISLVNHFISALACSRSIKHAELPYKKFNRKIKKWNNWIRALNVVMIVLILLGTIFLINFINQNI